MNWRLGLGVAALAVTVSCGGSHSAGPKDEASQSCSSLVSTEEIRSAFGSTFENSPGPDKLHCAFVDHRYPPSPGVLVRLVPRDGRRLFDGLKSQAGTTAVAGMARGVEAEWADGTLFLLKGEKRVEIGAPAASQRTPAERLAATISKRM